MCFGNRGDSRGDGKAVTVTCPPAEMRRIAAAWAKAFESAPQDFEKPAGRHVMEPFSINRPYDGAYEIIDWSKRLREQGKTNVRVIQIEFEREALLGPKATEVTRKAGTDWPALDTEHVAGVAKKLRAAGDLVRCFDSNAAPVTSRFKDEGAMTTCLSGITALLYRFCTIW